MATRARHLECKDHRQRDQPSPAGAVYLSHYGPQNQNLESSPTARNAASLQPSSAKCTAAPPQRPYRSRATHGPQSPRRAAGRRSQRIVGGGRLRSQYTKTGSVFCGFASPQCKVRRWSSKPAPHCSRSSLSKCGKVFTNRLNLCFPQVTGK